MYGIFPFVAFIIVLAVRVYHYCVPLDFIRPPSFQLSLTVERYVEILDACQHKQLYDYLGRGNELWNSERSVLRFVEKNLCQRQVIVFNICVRLTYIE